jgi:hypothetical protein
MVSELPLCRSAYGKTTGPYVPHLSLLYAELSDAEKDKVRLYTRTLSAAELSLHAHVSLACR